MAINGMPPAIPQCPANAFIYNSTLCACNPGLFLAGDGCEPLADGKWEMSSGLEAAPTLLATVFPLESIRRLTRSQEVLLGATFVALLAWLAFCFAVRFGRVAGGESIWFRIRWWISRLDFYFDTRHWLEDNRVVVKRKTELGGTFSVASWILFVGLFSALLYQIITKRTFEVHKVRPTNAPDLMKLDNDLEFNITTVSSMSCLNLRGLETLVIDSPGSIYYKVSSLVLYSNYTCHNTSRGPTVSIKCTSCKIPHEGYYISWQFVDLPNDPASAMGFQFNLTARDSVDHRHASYVSGTLKPGKYRSGGPQTLRGSDINILKIHLFPKKFNYKHHLNLIQPLLNDYLPGSAFSDITGLRTSLQSPDSGTVNVTLNVRYLSDYIVEVDRELVFGFVSFLAEVGGLSVISFALFHCVLSQAEDRFKKLRSEDKIMRNIRSRRRARRHWDKVRKYVRYTWGRSNIDLEVIKTKNRRNMSCGFGSLHEIKQPTQMLYFDNVSSIHHDTIFVPHAAENQDIDLGFQVVNK